MTALAIVIAVIILILLLRFGVSVEYGSYGLIVLARFGPLKLSVYPGKEIKEKKEVAKKPKKAKPEKAPDEKKPGMLKTLQDMVPAIKTTLNRLRRRLLIKNLTLHYIAAGDDPSKTAMMFGASSAAFGGILPLLESNFRIKRRDLRASADFEAAQQYIYVYATVSLAVWEALYIAFAMLPPLIRGSLKTGRSKKTGKDGEESGQAPNK
jgi:hypothetical protein